MADSTENIALTDEQAAEGSQGDGSHEIEPRYACELDEDHAGPPMALVRSFKDGTEGLWVQWTTGNPNNITRLPPCDADLFDDHGGEVVCLFSDGQLGARG